MAPQAHARILRTKQVFDRLGTSRVTLWRYIKAGTFPAPVKIFGRNAWLESTVDTWLAAQAAPKADA